MPHRLIVIAPSHYSEKAAWALDLAKLPYVREVHAPLAHIAAVKAAGGQRSTPTLVVEGEVKRVIGDSTDILRWIQTEPSAAWRPYGPSDDPEILAWEERFDADLGPHSRRLAYFHLLPHKALAVPCMTHGAPGWEATLISLSYPLVRAGMQKNMRIDATGAARSRDKLLAVFDAVDAALSDGRPYLCGDQISAADVTFAALAGPLLLPAAYPTPLPRLDQLPAAAQEALAGWADRPAGVYGLRLWAGRRAA